MRTVYKYSLASGMYAVETFSLDMPFGAKCLCVRVQDNLPKLWAEVESTNSVEPRWFVIIGAGHPLPPNRELKYVGSFEQDGRYVGHLFEVLP